MTRDRHCTNTCRCVHVLLPGRLPAHPHRESCGESWAVQLGVGLLGLSLFREHLDPWKEVSVSVHEHLCMIKQDDNLGMLLYQVVVKNEKI